MYKLISLAFVYASIFTWAFFAVPVFAAGEVCVAGFGDTATNGTYTVTGSLHSRPTYSNGTDVLCSDATTVLWYATSGLSNCNTGPANYYSNSVGSAEATPDLVPAGAWNVSGGASPAGTVVAGICGSGGGGAVQAPPFEAIFGLAATTTASSTHTVSIVDNPTQDVFNGYILFLSGMFAMLWLFKRKNH